MSHRDSLTRVTGFPETHAVRCGFSVTALLSASTAASNFFSASYVVFIAYQASA